MEALASACFVFFRALGLPFFGMPLCAAILITIATTISTKLERNRSWDTIVWNLAIAGLLRLRLLFDPSLGRKRIKMSSASPFIFDEFFASGKEESISPFLTSDLRSWGKNLPLKTALFSAVLLFSPLPPHFLFPLFLISSYYLSISFPALPRFWERSKILKISRSTSMS